MAFAKTMYSSYSMKRKNMYIVEITVRQVYRKKKNNKKLWKKEHKIQKGSICCENEKDEKQQNQI